MRQIIGPKRYGALTYRRSPSSGRAWGGPMNGQRLRCLLVSQILVYCDAVAIIETGTFRGTTTEWLSAFQMPVYSCEASAENFGFSNARLSMIPNVHLMHMDSRAALREILDGPLAQKSRDPILFYLDSHWNKDLPLADELEIIFSKCCRAIVLVDDFQVHDDPGYSYDDYGPGKALTFDYVTEKIRAYELATFYPHTSEAETGAKRGCILLANNDLMGPILERVPLLRKFAHTHENLSIQKA
ncbi:hypothetical protein [Methylocystis echinoides]|nr:hypothetical protein [Methylocystis echinoides]